MSSMFNSTGIHALINTISIAVGSALIMNGLIYGFGWNTQSEYVQKASFAPPGYVIGIVWMLLFALMAIARWTLNSLESVPAKQARLYVTVLLISCLIWPLYSLAIDSVIGGFLGTVWTILFALFVIVRTWAVSKKAAAFVIPVFIWTCFAVLIIITEAGWI